MDGFIDPGPPFLLVRRFLAPRDRVFDAWTQLDQLKQWFGPTGVTMPQATLDLKPGGQFHYCMRTPDGQTMWGKWIFREIAAPHRIVSVVAFSDPSGADARAPWDPEWPMHTLSTITFEEDGEGTLVRVEWSPLEASQTEQRKFAAGHDSMRQGWGGTMDRLQEHLAEAKEVTMSIAPYLNLNGRCAEALRFYEQALGAKVGMIHKFGDSPMAEQTPPDWRDKVMHASFTVGGSTLMASDGMHGAPEPLSGIRISIAVTDPAQAEGIYQALSQGGTVQMPLQETFWAQRFGMLTDQFGVPWMVNCEKSHQG